MFDLKPLLSTAGIAADKPQFCVKPHNEPYDKGELAEQMMVEMQTTIETKKGGFFSYDIRNINRSIGARVSGEIARHHGNYGMNESPIRVQLTGSAGQSFGVWNAGGLEMRLEGDANVLKMILFAFTYFIDENDQIPDSIPDYGYLDDIKVVEWVLNDVRDQVPYMPRA